MCCIYICVLHIKKKRVRFFSPLPRTNFSPLGSKITLVNEVFYKIPFDGTQKRYKSNN